MNTGILGFLSNKDEPEIHFEKDAEGWIVGVEFFESSSPTSLSDIEVEISSGEPAIPPSSSRTSERYKRLTSRKAVFAAMAEYDQLGADGFRSQHGFGAADTYVASYEGRTYDSKALVGVAFGKQFPDEGSLTASGFSGGRAHAAGHLHRLGFDIAGIERNPAHWTLAEVEVIVARYFAMLADQASGSYNRAAHLDAVQSALPIRNDSAVSRKLSNISAILVSMDLPILAGFGQLQNKQALLTAVVVDWLDGDPGVFDFTPVQMDVVGPDGESRETPPPVGSTLAEVGRSRRASRTDFAARDARNRALGKAGEAWALAALKAELVAAGRQDLADQVAWLSQTVGDGLGYDIASFDSEGRPLRIEVKTTNGGVAAPFTLSSNEISASQEDPASFILMRVYGLATAPRFYRLRGDLTKLCSLRPTTFIAVPA